MLLIKNISALVHVESTPKQTIAGADMSSLQCLEQGYLLIDNDKIADFGKQTDEKLRKLHSCYPDLLEYDAKQRMLFPSFCDSHTHLVWAGTREKEYEDRLHGHSYEEIALRGGGILNSAAKLRVTGESELFDEAMIRLNEIIKTGTGAVEIKSGYGLDVESELKMLRVIRRIKNAAPIDIKATFLGAHAIPAEFKGNKNGYLKLLTNTLIPLIAEEQLATYCDIFCEKNYFTKEDALLLFETAIKHGLTPKVHAEQLSHSGGIEAGVESNAISVDHLEFANEHDIELLKKSLTMPVLLPGAQLFLGLQHPPARQMIDSGLPVAIASDFNPGSCPSGNMHQMIALACMLYKLTPAEAIIAATTNSAYAMNLSSSHGSIAIGKKANFFFTPKHYTSFAFLPYYFGSNPVETIILNGKII